MGRPGSHPHIVTVFDLGDGDGQPYMVTELMEGRDAKEFIEKAPDHRIPLEQVIEIAKEVCAWLEFAHSKGIFHRDLKPGNVWLTADGTAKIGDFGLAVATDRSRLTQEGIMVGTVSYMPPEQAMGSEVTAKADLYSLGAMLYEMVTGRPPFVGDDSMAIIGQHLLAEAGVHADAASITVRSATGYYRRFSMQEAGAYILAARVGGKPLSRPHGFPARLVAPGKRGYDWVKWVTAIDVNDTSKWWQPPLPLQ